MICKFQYIVWNIGDECARRLPRLDYIDTFERKHHMTGGAVTDVFERSRDFNQVVEFCEKVFGYSTAHNAPALTIDKKLAEDDGLFFVALSREAVVGTVMAGYDGHRGWIYSLAVMPEYRRAGIGSRLLDHAESRLIAFGCVKIKLQFLETNFQVMSFYERHGYEVDPVISMGKQIYRG